MFQVIPYTPDLNLGDFFERAKEQGYFRHTSMDTFNHYKKEFKSRIWFIFQENVAVACFGTNSLFPRPRFMGENAFAIINKQCVLKYNHPIIGPKAFYQGHQNIVSQIAVTTCLKWLDELNEPYVPYIVSGDLPPPYNKHHKMLEGWVNLGFLSRERDAEDKRMNHGGVETVRLNVWKFNKELFEQQLSENNRWAVTYPNSL